MREATTVHTNTARGNVRLRKRVHRAAERRKAAKYNTTASFVAFLGAPCLVVSGWGRMARQAISGEGRQLGKVDMHAVTNNVIS